ncbi:pirin family protein [Nocardioides ferulae]|uniref:pirin family protein n=1 Tax=Nocardioides ferulae TaxID=2340821 RepID=UPI0013DE1406|nr:pirin family protein [Nocardioides ferulae]
MVVEVRRGSSRFISRLDGGQTRHSFSFGEHYDAERVRFGPMVCHDEHHLAGGKGFEAHSHSDVEIVTWVLTGALEHGDDRGTADSSARVEPGTVQVLDSGPGVTHREVAVADVGPTRFVQVWLSRDVPATEPSYSLAAAPLEPGVLTVVAGAGGAVPLRTPGATFRVARLEGGQTLTLPDEARQHVFVARGALLRSSLAEPLAEGDAFLITDDPGRQVTAAVPSELLVWSFAG